MLKGISSLLSPALLAVLSEMGHGDEIVLADANFPSSSIAEGGRLIRADGIPMADLLSAILPLFPLDQYDSENFILMEVVPNDPCVPTIWDEFRTILQRHEPDVIPSMLERQAYYKRAKKAFAVVATGERAQYANIILKKGVVYPHETPN
ncbi:MAG: L-fucose mutarotase [Clostridia bacterium]|nr:L-fucose mutarotase [Clostridia bacterium]